MVNVFRLASETYWWEVFTACNFEVSKLNICPPAFYKQCLVAWSELNEREPSSVHKITNQVIRNNNFLFTEEILRIKAFVKSGTYFQLMMNNLTLNKVQFHYECNQFHASSITFVNFEQLILHQ